VKKHRLAVASAAVLSLAFLVGCPAKPKTGGPVGPADLAAGEATYKAKCLACHTIGKGDIVGPDLKGVTERREKPWLAKWLRDPDDMLKNDPVAKELLKKYKNVPMPNQQLSEQDIENVLAFLATDGGDKPAGETKAEETKAGETKAEETKAQ
jgi:cytochrome c2